MVRYEMIAFVLTCILVLGLVIFSTVSERERWFMSTDYRRINESYSVEIIKEGDLRDVFCAAKVVEAIENEPVENAIGIPADVVIGKANLVNDSDMQHRYCSWLKNVPAFYAVLRYMPCGQLICVAVILIFYCQATSTNNSICMGVVCIFGLGVNLLTVVLFVGSLLYATLFRLDIGFRFEELLFPWYIYMFGGTVESCVIIIPTLVKLYTLYKKGSFSIPFNKIHHSEDWKYRFIFENCTKKKSDIEMMRTGTYPVIDRSRATEGNETALFISAETAKHTDIINEFRELFRRMWNPALTGIGRDAKHLSHNDVVIENVVRVTNPSLFQKYQEKRVKIREKSYKHEFPTLEKHDCLAVETSDPISKLHGNSELRANIDEHVLNEHYLFHGTSEENIHSIVNNGFDLSKASHGMLGKGIYFAESPIKADQYTDRLNRTQCLDTSTKYQMILARVTLGHLVIRKMTDQACRQAKAPPCESCRHLQCKNPFHRNFDSVVFEKKSSLFREFVIYNGNQAFPAYVITYRRINSVV